MTHPHGPSSHGVADADRVCRHARPSARLVIPWLTWDRLWHSRSRHPRSVVGRDPPTVEHHVAPAQLVLLAPGLDAARHDSEEEVRTRGLPGVETGPLGETVGGRGLERC